MTFKQRISAFSELGLFFNFIINNETTLEKDLHEKFNQWQQEIDFAISDAETYNNWFTKENIIASVNALADMMSDKNAVEGWLEKYPEPTATSKKILLVLPGNIPAVGFHDVLCTLLSGHSAEIKLSSDDKFLIPWMLRNAEKYFPEWTDRIHYHEGLMTGFDAVIATGSNQSAKTFDTYFSGKPNIIFIF